MKHKLLYFIIILLIVNLSYLFSKSTEKKNFNLPAEIISTGGVGITSYDKLGIIFMNPASLGLYDSSTIPVFRFGLKINYDILELFGIDKIITGENQNINFTNLNTLASDLSSKIFKLRGILGLNTPLMTGYIGHGFGFLIYNTFNLSSIVNIEPLLPSLDFNILGEFGVLAGFGFQIPLSLNLGKLTKTYGGVVLKYITKLKYENSRLDILDGLNILQDITEIGTLPELYLGQAIGSDLGFLIKFENIFFGLVIRDWFFTLFTWKELKRINYSETNFTWEFTTNKITNTYYEPTIDLGINYTLPNILSKYLVSNIKFSFDIVNAFDFTENYFLKLRMGAELKLFYILILRSGLYKGYPSFGIGIDLPLIKINLAYYTEEYGIFPGNIPVGNILLDINLMI